MPGPPVTSSWRTPSEVSQKEYDDLGGAKPLERQDTYPENPTNCPERHEHSRTLWSADFKVNKELNIRDIDCVISIYLISHTVIKSRSNNLDWFYYCNELHLSTQREQPQP